MKKTTLIMIRHKLIPVLKAHRVTHASIIGSYARGEQHSKSDIDIVVRIQHGADLLQLVQLRTALQKTINKKVDLVEYEGIRKELKATLLHKQIPLL